MANLTSDQLMKEARDQMIDGREPETIKEWFNVLYFCFCNIKPGFRKSAIAIFCVIYDAPFQGDNITVLIDKMEAHNERQGMLRLRRRQVRRAISGSPSSN